MLVDGVGGGKLATERPLDKNKERCFLNSGQVCKNIKMQMKNMKTNNKVKNETNPKKKHQEAAKT